MIHEGVLCVNVFTYVDADVCVIFHLQKIVPRTVNKHHIILFIRALVMPARMTRPHHQYPRSVARALVVNCVQ
jgi:hypothetical protein